MFFIVWYHLLAYYLYIYPHHSSNDFVIEATIPSLHIGVILFVLISGYYGIKPSLKGFARLLIITMVYFLPLQLTQLAIDGRLLHPRAVLSSLMFITNTPYWFIRTYLYLYLSAPLVNTYIKSSSKKQNNALLVILGIIAVYFGTTQGDGSLNDGKNLINFLFIYLLGYTIKNYQTQIQNIKSTYYFIAYLILNALIIISLLSFQRGTILGDEIWQLTFPYCSPILILNAALLFMAFSRKFFYLKYVNLIASSMFAVYLLHCHPFIVGLYQPNISQILSISLSKIYALSALCTVLIIVLSVLIDKMLTPIWRCGDKLCVKLQDRFEK